MYDSTKDSLEQPGYNLEIKGTACGYTTPGHIQSTKPKCHQSIVATVENVCLLMLSYSIDVKSLNLLGFTFLTKKPQTPGV